MDTGPWTPEQDEYLVRYGRALCDGHGFVAEHDLGHTAQEGRDRIKELRATRPDWVASLEAQELVYDGY
jgi:hypothetical protein